MSPDPILDPLDQQSVGRLGTAAVRTLISARWTDAHLTLAALLANEHAHDQLTVAGARLPALDPAQRKAVEEAFDALDTALNAVRPDDVTDDEGAPQ